MKRFLYKITIFTLPILSLFWPLDLYLSHNLQKSSDTNGEFEVLSDIYNHNISCDISVYGSSRAWVHINPLILEDSLNQSVYNFGIDGHNFWLQYLRHLEIIKNDIKPKQIILSIDEFSMQKRADLYQLNQFLPYMLWNENIMEYTSSYQGYTTIDYYLPLVRYFGKYNAVISAVKNSISPDEVKYRNHGYRGIVRDWAADFDEARAILDQYYINVDSSTVKLFDRFLGECKELNIEVILVNTPEYIEGQEFITNRQEVLDLISKIADKHQVTFLDYSNDSICLRRELFYNATHLNSTGSDLFTTKLVKDIREKSKKLLVGR